MRYQENRFTLDLQKHQSQTTVNVFQGDTAVRLYISLTDGGKPYMLEGRSFAVFYGKRQDGKPLVHRCEVINSAEIMYEFQPATSYVLGIVNCQCRVYTDNQELITAPRFSINVEEKVVEDDDFPITDDERSLLDEILAGDAARIAAEEKRQVEEAIRIDNESVRQIHEYGGTNADGETIIGRVAAEVAREEAEAERERKEGLRDAEEQKRIDAENAREGKVQEALDIGTEALELARVANDDLSKHSTSEEAHNDIRIILRDFMDRVNTLLDSDDGDLDQMSEIIAYINSNKSLIDAITTSKVNVSDIVDNLVTNLSNKPLSAAQGVVIKGLIDSLTTDKITWAGRNDNYDLVPITASSGRKSYMGVTPKLFENSWSIPQRNATHGTFDVGHPPLPGQTGYSANHPMTIGIADDRYVQKLSNNKSALYFYHENKNNSGTALLLGSTYYTGNDDGYTIPLRGGPTSSTHPGTFEVNHPELDTTKSQYSAKHPMTVGMAEERYAKSTEYNAKVEELIAKDEALGQEINNLVIGQMPIATSKTPGAVHIVSGGGIKVDTQGGISLYTKEDYGDEPRGGLYALTDNQIQHLNAFIASHFKYHYDEYSGYYTELNVPFANEANVAGYASEEDEMTIAEHFIDISEHFIDISEHFTDIENRITNTHTPAINLAKIMGITSTVFSGTGTYSAIINQEMAKELCDLPKFYTAHIEVISFLNSNPVREHFCSTVRFYGNEQIVFMPVLRNIKDENSNASTTIASFIEVNVRRKEDLTATIEVVIPSHILTPDNSILESISINLFTTAH